MNQRIQCDVCIVGAGPAGMMAALLLAQSGIHVILLERSASYPAAREFRGESISQQSIALLDDLGVLNALKKYDYLQTKQMQIIQNEQMLLEIDFTQMPFAHQCPIDIPQPILLDELLNVAKQQTHFEFIKGATCTQLIEEKIDANGDLAIVGIKARVGDQHIEIQSRLVIGADGRYTKMRKWAQLGASVLPAKRDVIWFKVPRPKNWGDIGQIIMKNGSSLIVLPTYPDLLRVGLSIPSGSFKQWNLSSANQNQAKNQNPFHQKVNELHASIGALANEHLRDTNDLSLLDIFTAQVPKWYRRGFVLIGDAAHTLSPILGQGVNQSLLDAAYLAPMVFRACQNPAQKIVDENVLRDFQNQRQKEIAFIHNFQHRQEWMIHLNGWFAKTLRHTFYRFIGNARFVRNQLSSKLYFDENVATHLRQIRKNVQTTAKTVRHSREGGNPEIANSG